MVQDSGIGSVVVSVRSPSSIEHSSLSGLCLPTGKRWRAKEAEHIGQNAILKPTGYRLMEIGFLLAFFFQFISML